MKIPTCHFCNKNAAWQRPWDKVNLCVQHFNSSFLRKVQRTINRYKLFDRHDIIAVGVSGGKDSVVLLDVLSKLQKKFPSKLIAISIDEGIYNYREEGLKYAKLAAERADVDLQIYSYKDKFGYDLDEALVLLGPERKAACSYCGPFRRKSLNEAARDVGATKLATAHNADDEAQTVLMNLMRGDLLKTLHSNPVPVFKNKSFINRVKPFRRTTEQEIVLYANFNKLPYQEMSCPHAIEAMRGSMRDILIEYMEQDPGVIFSILNSSDSLFDLADLVPESKIHEGNRPILNCVKCGEPTSQEYCMVCRIINDLENKTITS